MRSTLCTAQSERRKRSVLNEMSIKPLPTAPGSTRKRWTDGEPEVRKTPTKQSSRFNRTDKQELTDSRSTLKTCSGSSRRKSRHGERKVDTGPIPGLFSYLQLIPDGMRGEENLFSPMVCHWLLKPYPRAGPGVGGQYNVDFVVFCVLYFLWFSGFLFCLQRRMIMNLQGRKLGEGKWYDQNILYEKTQ